MFIDKSKVMTGWGALAAILLFFAVCALGIAVEKPVGSVAGRIAMEREGFNLATYQVGGKRAYALAIGPNGGDIVERGAWVNPDGTFRINQLPVGEYQIKIRAAGFSTVEQSGIFVEDARITRLKKPVHLSILEPSVNIASNTRVFSTGEAPYFWLNAMGSDRAKVRVYRFDVLKWLARSREKNPPLEFSGDLSLYKPYRQGQGRLFQTEKPVRTLVRKLNRDSEDWSHAEFKLDRPLPSGEYALVAEVSNLKNQRDWNVMWFSVSDLGLIIKQSPEKTLVRAIDLKTLRPVKGARLRLLNREQPKQAAGEALRTSADGFATFPVPMQRRADSSFSLIAVGEAGVHRAFGGIDYWNGFSKGYETYFYTERPIYRLDQMVYFKGITRLRTPDGFRAPKAGLPLQVTIEDPDNNKLWEGRLLANAYGSFHGAWKIPANGKTGAYQVSVAYPDGTDSYHRFEVAQYRKPEYQVEVKPLAERITAGSRLRARVRASYYFGGPVANARVKYNIYADTDWAGRYRLLPRPAEEAYFDDWTDDEEGGHADTTYAGALVGEGYVQTDETGEAIVEFNTPPARTDADTLFDEEGRDKRYTVQAEVTDLSRMAVIGNGIQSVTEGDFIVSARPAAEVTKAGEPVRAEIAAVDYQGRPVAHRTVEIKLSRWNWDRVKEEYRGSTTLSRTTVTTDARGRAQVTLPTDPHYLTDNYYLEAEARDDAGHAIHDRNGVWIASEANPYVRDGESTRQEAFSIHPDKRVYRPGDVVRAMIAAPVSGKEHAEVIVAVEGARLHQVMTVPMNATARMVEIPVKADYAPNVYLSATLAGPKHQFYHQSVPLRVSPEDRFLNIAIRPDKPRYRPGETAVYTVTATHADGKPAAGVELSLGVVDESIYAIRPEAAPDIRKFFYAKIENAVTTLSSFPEEYSGGPDKMEPRVRKDFRDMAAWLPTLITDAHGVATAKVKLPDNLTTWRATVRGVTPNTEVGSAIASVIATQDLLLRLALPRFYTQYDQAYLTAIVHNDTGVSRHVTLTLDASPQFKVGSSATLSMDVAAGRASRHMWPVTLTQPGEARVHLRAVSDTEGDALEQTVPVRPLGIEIQKTHAGVLKTADARLDLPLDLPSGTPPTQAKVRLSVSASAIGPVLGGFADLIDYPYGCTEQTMSRLMPSVIAIRLSHGLQLPMSRMLDARFHEVALRSLARLRDYRHLDGGWGWWQFDDSDPYLTAYVMEGLHLLRESAPELFRKADLPEGWDKDGLSWLKNRTGALAKQLSDPKIASDRSVQTERLLDLAYMQYVLSLYGNRPEAPVRRLWHAQMDRLPPEALSYFALAFHATGDRAAAGQTWTALDRLADSAGEMLNWDHTDRLRKQLGYPSKDYTYRFSGVEATALALRAAIAVNGPDGKNAERLAAVERWLILQRGPDGWENTKTTALVLRALTEKALTENQGEDATALATDFVLRGTLWPEPLRFAPENRYDRERTTETTVQALNAPMLHLEKQGPGALYYHQLLRYPLALKPGDMIPQIAMPAGLTVRRAFYRLHAEPVGPTGTLRLKADAFSGGSLKAGETVLMKVMVEAPVALPYIILEAPLPSGGEVISDDPREALASEAVNHTEETEEPSVSGDWGSWWWSHQDILDDRLVLFATRLPAGRSEFHALVRLEQPGVFQMNPVLLEGMYSDRIRAYSPLDQLRITE